MLKNAGGRDGAGRTVGAALELPVPLQAESRAYHPDVAGTAHVNREGLANQQLAELPEKGRITQILCRFFRCFHLSL